MRFTPRTSSEIVGAHWPPQSSTLLSIRFGSRLLGLTATWQGDSASTPLRHISRLDGFPCLFEDVSFDAWVVRVLTEHLVSHIDGIDVSADAGGDVSISTAHVRSSSARCATRRRGGGGAAGRRRGAPPRRPRGCAGSAPALRRHCATREACAHFFAFR